MQAMLKVLYLILASALASENVYSGFKVYDIKARSADDLKLLQNLEALEGESRSLDFLSFHNNLDDDIRLLVKPEEQNFIENLFKTNKLNYKVSIDDVQK